MLISIKSQLLEKKLRKLMEAKKYKEAFDLVYSKEEHSEIYYMDPEKTHYIRTPEYILVEDLIKTKDPVSV